MDSDGGGVESGWNSSGVEEFENFQGSLGQCLCACALRFPV